MLAKLCSGIRVIFSKREHSVTCGAPLSGCSGVWSNTFALFLQDEEMEEDSEEENVEEV